MNINKQQTKGNKMKKIAMIIGVLTMLASNANATGWNLPEIITSYDSGYGSTSFYSSDRGLLGTSYSNGFGGTTLYLY